MNIFVTFHSGILFVNWGPFALEFHWTTLAMAVALPVALGVVLLRRPRSKSCPPPLGYTANMSEAEATPAPRKRRWSFSLRTLLVLATIGSPMIWIAGIAYDRLKPQPPPDWKNIQLTLPSSYLQRYPVIPKGSRLRQPPGPPRAP